MDSSDDEDELWDTLLQCDFASFIAKSFGTVNPGVMYMPNWHIELLAEYLEAARVGQIRRLIINMPPRCMKSLCVSVAWPAWILGKNPSARILTASYARSLSTRHSQDCRHVMQSDWYRDVFPDTQIERAQNEKHLFVTSKRGYRMATSVGAAATGQGGNILILDDPISALQATMHRWRRHVNEWYDHTFSTRLDDKVNGAIVLVMQRLHQHDLSGHLIERGGFEHLTLPMLFREPKRYHYGSCDIRMAEGGLLHPARDNMDVVNELRRDIGEAHFSAQYQQQPLPEEGALVKAHWLRRYEAVDGAVLAVVQSWDTAIKTGKSHDRSVCLTFAETAAGFYLIDAQVLKVEYPDLRRAFYAQAEKYRPHAILVEDKAGGQQLIQDVRRESSLPVIGISPSRDKVTRLAAVTPILEAGRLFLPKKALWLAGFEEELLLFPGGAYDDQVDALSQFLQWKRGQPVQGMRIRTV